MSISLSNDPRGRGLATRGGHDEPRHDAFQIEATVEAIGKGAEITRGEAESRF
jgi:hypothetical protein